MDFAYRNVTFDMKQLVEVLQCGLQVTINEGLMETQMELLETIGSFVDHFQSEMTILSPPDPCCPEPPVDQMWWQPSTARCHLER